MQQRSVAWLVVANQMSSLAEAAWTRSSDIHECALYGGDEDKFSRGRNCSKQRWTLSARVELELDVNFGLIKLPFEEWQEAGARSWCTYKGDIEPRVQHREPENQLQSGRVPPRLERRNRFSVDGKNDQPGIVAFAELHSYLLMNQSKHTSSEAIR